MQIHRRLRRWVLAPAAASLALVLGAPAASAGAGWTIVPSPNPDNTTNVLNAVFARTATDAWAVGTMGELVHDDDDGMLTVHWNGTAWTWVPTVNVHLRNEQLSAVSGAGANDVWAVGGISTTSNNQPRLPLAAHWNGASWTIVPTPTGPTGTVRGGLRGVAAVGSANVWAVGRARAGSALIEHWDGSAWSVVPAPPVNAGLNAITAISPTNLWAVGDPVANPDGTTSAVVMRFNGTAWQRVTNTSTVPANFTHNGLRSVAALGPNDIWAVGSINHPVTGGEPLIEHWNGRTWSRVAAPPRPPNTTHFTLSGLAAVTPTDVWAVGTRSKPDLTEDSLALHWNGTTWSVASTPDSGAPFDGLAGAATTPGGSPLWAVGRSIQTGGARTTLILRF